MRATGIVRQLDQLGRIVVPKELRRTFQIDEGDALEIFTENNTIILRKYVPGCALCGGMDDLKDIWDKKVCCKCRELIKK
jgi:AbrB family transcriptional regulator, transcriptional pleiotropic regulator of transition state genes